MDVLFDLFDQVAGVAEGDSPESPLHRRPEHFTTRNVRQTLTAEFELTGPAPLHRSLISRQMPRWRPR
jgi:hypothetical protein